MSSDSEAPTTSIASHSPDDVFIRGKSLCKELIGQLSFTEMVYFQILGRMPTADQAALIDACLVALMEHGLTPSVLAARLIYSSAPEAHAGRGRRRPARRRQPVRRHHGRLRRAAAADRGRRGWRRRKHRASPWSIARRACRCPASAIRRTSPTIRAPFGCLRWRASARWPDST